VEDEVRIALVIETYDRRKQGRANYLATTLRNLQRVGVWASPHLHSVRVVQDGVWEDDFWGGVASLLPPGAIIDSAPRGRRPNALQAIRSGAAEHDADWVVTLEDDLDFIDHFLDNAAAWLEDHGHFDAVMFPLGSSWGETVAPVNTSLYLEPGESVLGPGQSFQYARRAVARGDDYILNPGYWGGQALAWERPIAEHLAEWFAVHLPDEDLGGKDVLLEKWGRGLKTVPFCVPVPSFVQHIGRESCMDVPFFEFPWPGRGWDYPGRAA
jgi:hypothetical protein